MICQQNSHISNPPIRPNSVPTLAVFTQPLVGALVDVLALVERGGEAVPGRAAALVRAGQVHALRQPAARRAVERALVDVAAEVGRVIVLVAGERQLDEERNK